jgi:hypothetical protein
MCFLSAAPFCWCACRQETRWTIPVLEKKEFILILPSPIRLKSKDFSDQIASQQGFEIHGNAEKLRIYV